MTGWKGFRVSSERVRKEVKDMLWEKEQARRKGDAKCGIGRSLICLVGVTTKTKNSRAERQVVMSMHARPLWPGWQLHHCPSALICTDYWNNTTHTYYSPAWPAASTGKNTDHLITLIILWSMKWSRRPYYWARVPQVGWYAHFTFPCLPPWSEKDNGSCCLWRSSLWKL